MGKLFIIDGPHCLYRAAFAHGELSYERKGQAHLIGGVYGFMNMVRIAHRKLGGGLVMVAWEDPERRTRAVRRGLYPEYKMRNKAEEVDYGMVEFRKFVEDQRVILCDFLSIIGCPQAYAPGWEADDVIATVCDQMSDHDISILTGDKDMYTLLRDGVEIIRPRHAQEGYDTVTLTSWKEKHKVEPGQWPLVLALMGDDADNIPGVQGIGPVRAERLVAEFGTLDAIIAAAKADKEGRFSQAIVAAESQLRLNLQLTVLHQDAPLEFTPPRRNTKMVADRLREYKFNSMTAYADVQGILEMGCAWQAQAT